MEAQSPNWAISQGEELALFSPIRRPAPFCMEMEEACVDGEGREKGGEGRDREKWEERKEGNCDQHVR